MTATFLATHPKHLPAASFGRLERAVRGTQYWISCGSPEHGQAAVTLCFNGPREQADPAMIEAFRKICGTA